MVASDDSPPFGGSRRQGVARSFQLTPHLQVLVPEAQWRAEGDGQVITSTDI